MEYQLERTGFTTLQFQKADFIFIAVILLLQCQVLYIDYGNSEVLRRSEIVEITENLQFPGVAKKYKLWGLQLSANIDLNQFDRVSQVSCDYVCACKFQM